MRRKLPNEAVAANDLVEIPAQGLDWEPSQKASARAGRIMYIECKAGSQLREAWIGRVTFSKSGRTLYYGGMKFQSLKGRGFKANYYELESGDDYWISGPKRNGQDGLYGVGAVPIDEEARDEYWRKIRRQPWRVGESIS